jgi:prepilin-type N-terminal cleavage/methylation domain-containing protein
MKKAFTLIELMIIIAIITIIASIGISNINKNRDNRNIIPGPDKAQIDTKPLYPQVSERFVLEGHSYIVITRGIHSGMTNTLHDPDCPKCYPTKIEK